jgi:lysophospholipase L1-like esterase
MGPFKLPSNARLSVEIGNLAVALGVAIAIASSPGCAQTTSSPLTPTPARSPTPAPLRMVVLGDSIASGTVDQGGQGPNGWPAIVAQKLGLLSLLSAQPGTGYSQSAGFGAPYTDRVNDVIALKPNILIVEGSANDVDAAATRRAAAEVLGKLRSELPEARILVIGPFYLDKTYGRTTPVNDAVKAVATSLGLAYVDTIKAGWFTGPAHRLVGSDGIHPTDEGHRYLANLIVPLVSRLLPAGYTIPTPTSNTSP